MKKTPDKRRSTIDFDAEMYDKIKAIADREERDFGSQVRWICKQWLEQNTSPDTPKSKKATQS